MSDGSRNDDSVVGDEEELRVHCTVKLSPRQWAIAAEPSLHGREIHPKAAKCLDDLMGTDGRRAQAGAEYDDGIPAPDRVLGAADDRQLGTRRVDLDEGDCLIPADHLIEAQDVDLHFLDDSIAVKDVVER